MIWDGLIALMFAGLAMAGWNTGIINSWRGPVAMIIATVATQLLYVDFATFIVQQLRVQPVQAVAMSYFLLWVFIEIISEIILSLFFQWGSKERPVAPQRAAGAALGVLKALCVVIFPLMAMQADNKVPAPPDQEPIYLFLVQSGIEDSALLSYFKNVAAGLTPALGGVVLSQKEPSFQAAFPKIKRAEDGTLQIDTESEE